MDYYKQVIEDKFNELVEWGEKPEQILERWENGETEDDFGNLTGSRFCNRYEAEEALKGAGFPFNQDLMDLLHEVYDDRGVAELMERGAEVVDVVLCELTVPYMIEELKEEIKK